MNVFVVVAALIVTVACANAQSDLQDCVQAAKLRSEILADQSEQINQAEEHYRQAKGSIFPAVSAMATYFRQDASAPSGNGGAFSPSSQPLVKLTVSQPLFRGLREFGAIRQTQLLETAQVEAKYQAGIQLYNDVAQSFFSILSLEQDLRNLDTEVGLYRKRIEELNSRVRIGRSRKTEVLAIEASLSSLAAQVEQVHGQLQAAREVFAFLSGLPRDTALLMDRSLSMHALDARNPLGYYLEFIEKRPDVRSAENRVEASEESIGVAKGAHLPSLDLNGNYYFLRSGISENVKWDFQVSFTLPIFAGGVIQSKVREAASQRNQAELARSRIRRQAEEEVRMLYQGLQYDRSQIAALEKARDLSGRLYREQTRDYRLGLVNNIDVLQALIAFQESERALDRARFVAQLDSVRFELATGLRSLQ